MPRLHLPLLDEDTTGNTPWQYMQRDSNKLLLRIGISIAPLTDHREWRSKHTGKAAVRSTPHLTWLSTFWGVGQHCITNLRTQQTLRTQRFSIGAGLSPVS